MCRFPGSGDNEEGLTDVAAEFESGKICAIVGELRLRQDNSAVADCGVDRLQRRGNPLWGNEYQKYQ